MITAYYDCSVAPDINIHYDDMSMWCVLIKWVIRSSIHMPQPSYYVILIPKMSDECHLVSWTACWCGYGQQIPVFLLVPARCCDTSPYLNLPLCISRWWSLINKILLHLHSLVLSRQTFQYLCLLKKRNSYSKMKYQVPWKFNTSPNTHTIWHENWRQHF